MFTNKRKACYVSTYIQFSLKKKHKCRHRDKTLGGYAVKCQEWPFLGRVTINDIFFLHSLSISLCSLYVKLIISIKIKIACVTKNLKILSLICINQLRLPQQTPQTGWLNNGNLLLKVLEMEKSKVKVLADLISGENSLLSWRMATFPLCAYVAFPRCCTWGDRSLVSPLIGAPHTYDLT